MYKKSINAQAKLIKIHILNQFGMLHRNIDFHKHFSTFFKT